MSFIIQVKSQVDGKKKYIAKEDFDKCKFHDTEYLLGSKVTMQDDSVWYICGYGDTPVMDKIQELANKLLENCAKMDEVLK